MSALTVSRLHWALKLHFTTDYDYFKYNGITNSYKSLSQEQLNVFEKLDKRYKKDIQDFFVANFVETPNIWIHDFLLEDSNEIFINYKKRKESISYIFKNDISYLKETYNTLNKVLSIKNPYPPLLTSILQEKISLETCVILNDLIHYDLVWEKKLKEDFLWNDFKIKLSKFSGFVNFDKKRIKNMLKTMI